MVRKQAKLPASTWKLFAIWRPWNIMNICIKDENTLPKSNVCWNPHWLNYCSKSCLLEASFSIAYLQVTDSGAITRYVYIYGIVRCIALFLGGVEGGCNYCLFWGKSEAWFILRFLMYSDKCNSSVSIKIQVFTLQYKYLHCTALLALTLCLQ